MTGPPRIARVPCGAPVSERLLRAVGMFGLMVARGGAGPRADGGLVERALGAGPGSVVLVTGASGCGKSTLVGAIAREAERRRVRVADGCALLAGAPRGRAVIDLFGAGLEGSLALLSAAGLGEAGLWARTVGELSEGQRARLGVALAMDAGGLVVLDEFCSTLDRVTARGVARTVRRWATRSGARVICATAHDDLAGALAPDLVLEPEQTP